MPHLPFLAGRTVEWRCRKSRRLSGRTIVSPTPWTHAGRRESELLMEVPLAILTSSSFWTAAQAVGTVAAFFVLIAQVKKAQAQIAALRDQTDALRAATEYDLLLRVDGVFNSERLQRDRRNAARALKIRAQVRPAEGQELWANTT